MNSSARSHPTSALLSWKNVYVEVTSVKKYTVVRSLMIIILHPLHIALNAYALHSPLETARYINWLTYFMTK